MIDLALRVARRVPQRQIYTSVRASRSHHSAIRAFRGALQASAQAEAPALDSREIPLGA